MITVKRRVLSSALAIILLAVVFFSGFVEYDKTPAVYALQSGDYTFTVTGDAATITEYSGSGGNVVIPGELDGFVVVSVAVTAFRNNTLLNMITFPASLTSIAGSTGYSSGAFYGCSNITMVTFEDSAVDIGNYAFYGLGKLIEVNFGNSLKTIGVDAFRGCSALTSITFPASLTSIANGSSGAFYGCNNLTKITFEDSAATIGNNAFYGLSKLTELNLGNQIKSIGSYAFYGCTGLVNITVPTSVTGIGTYAFSECTGLTSVILYDCLVDIPNNMFYNCSKLSAIDFGSKVLSIGNSAFYNTGFVEITIPASVISIGTSAFANCALLTTVYVTSGSTTIGSNAFTNCPKLENVIILDDSLYSYDDYGVLFNAAKTMLIQYPPNISLTSYIIPDGVATISDNAFYNAKNLVSITMPDSLRTIGTSAFYGCTALVNVSFGEGVTTINATAFYGCTALTEITFPASLTSIAGSSGASFGAFYGCSNITRVTFEDSVVDIGSYAFYGLGKLVEVNLGNSIKTIGVDAFRSCSALTSITFPASLTSIANSSAGAFYGCNNLAKITFEDSVATIGNNAFYGLSKLTDVNLGNQIKSIGSSTFYDCTGLTSMIIPASVTSIGSSAFSGCTGMKSVILDDCLVDIPNSMFYNCSKLSAIDFGSKVLSIGSSAFYNTGFVEITIPASVISIGTSAFANCALLTETSITGVYTSIGTNAFLNCPKLASINIDQQNFYYISVDGVLYDKQKTLLIAYPANKAETDYTILEGVISISDNAFYNAKNLVAVNMPNSLKTVGTSAFYGCTTLTDLSFGEGVTTINASAFYGCAALTSITFPASLTSIVYGSGYSSGVFYGCSNLTSITFENSAADIGNYAFYGLSKLIEVNLGSRVKTIGNAAFQGCAGLISMNIPSSVSSIGSSAFQGCTGLLSIDIPTGINSISNNTFYGCTGLTSIVIPSGVTLIGSYAFQACTGLRTVDIPSSVSSIGSYAFQGCTGITSITISVGVTIIGSAAFQGCNSLTSITIPSNVNSIENSAFYNCADLTSVIIEEGVKSIGGSAFSSCRNLTSVDIPWSVESIGNSAFSGSLNVIIYTWWGSYAESYAIANSIPVKYFTNEAAMIEVSLPALINSSQYDNMKINLNNKTNSTQFSINVTDKLSYSFRGLSVGDVYWLTLTNRHGYVMSEINEITLLEGLNVVAFNDLLPTRDVSLKVFDNTGADVATHYKVQWYSENGEYLSQGSRISDVLVGAGLEYRIELDSTLGSQYINPAPTNYTVTDGENSIEITLAPIPIVTVSGTVKNAQTGEALPGAVVSISQQLNGKYPKTFVVTTGGDGFFTTQVFNDASTITISNNNFISTVISKPSFSGDENLGVINLSPISGAVITLNMSYTYSAKPSETQLKTTMPPDYPNLRFSVYNQTENKAINDFVYQYPYLVLPDSVNVGDTIRIIVSGSGNDFNAVQADTILDGVLKASVDIDIMQHGSLKAMFASSANDENVVLIYNAGGKLVKAYDFRFNTVSSDPLPDGSYSIVFMGKSLFFDSIQNLSDLTAARLVQNVDYVRRQINITSGVITNIDDISIPRFDESKFYYTDNAKTSFTVNKTSAVAGSYFTLRSQLAFRNMYKSQVSEAKLIVQLPEGCTLYENSVVCGANNTFTNYILEDNTLTIPLVNVEEVVRFCVIPTKSGKYMPNALVEFKLEGETIRQPIGAAGFEATEMKINVTEKTARKRVTVAGTTMPDSEIIIFDNGIEVGRTQSLLNGDWEISIDLVKPYAYSSHEIFTQVNLLSGSKVYSEKKKLTRIESFIELSKIKMFYRNIVVEFDYLNPSRTIPSFTYLPGYTSFTFNVEFTDNNPELIYNVRINVTTTSGNIKILPAIFDSEKHIWIATGDFDSNNMPTNVGVDYFQDEGKLILDLNFVDEIKADFAKVDESKVRDYISCVEIVNTFENSLMTRQSSSGFGDYIGLFTVSNSNGEIGEFYYHTSSSIIDTDSLHEIVADADQSLDSPFISLTDYDGRTYYYNVSYSSEELVITEIDLQNNIITTNSFFTNEKTFSLGEGVYGLGELFSDISTVYDLLGFSDGAVGFFSDTLGDTGSVLAGIRSITDHAERQQKIDMLKELDSNHRYDDYLAYLERRAISSMKGEHFLTIVGCAGLVGDIVSRAIGALFSLHTQFTDNMINIVEQGLTVLKNCDDIYDVAITDTFVKGGGWVAGSGKAFREVYDRCNDENPTPGQSVRPVRAVIDPSGYVYEAVVSNRLPGVTTTAFYKTTEEDMYGDEHEVIKKWDAENYSQQNPLTTNEIGWYNWDVPVGDWQIKYEKDGYQTVYSTDIYGWLPVPPPQLEVHVGMTSYAQPNITRVNGYEEYIEIVFDRYMDITTINSSSIIVTSNGAPVEIAIEFPDKEVDQIDEDRHYARVVHIKPTTGIFSVSDEVSLNIDASVSTYADVQMANDFTQTVPIKPEPKQLVLPDEINLEYGETKAIEVSILPLEAAAGKKITAVSGSTYLVTVNAEAFTDGVGKAVFTATGELPGSTELMFSVDGTLISQIVKVNMAMPYQENSEKAAKPTANLTSGEVEKGTLLILSTITPDATIYYTLDGSCPCAEGARKVYTGPIEINENMSILAAAYKDGMDYSDSLALNFIVRTQSDTGVKVSGQIRTYNPDKSATIKLMQGDKEIDKIDIPVETGTGQRDQDFEFKDVAPGTYSLVITKDAHTKFTLRSIIVSDQNVDLTEDDRPEVRLMILRCGDVNGDGVIDDRDLTILWLTSNYFKNTAQAANPLCDFNGDGVIDDRDLTTLWLTYNYYRGEIAI